MPVGGKVTRPLNNARQQCRLGQSDVLQIFVEVSFARFSEAADRKRSPLPQIDPVCVELENLLLREFLLQFLGDQHFRQLALDGLFRGKEKSSRKLHGERGTA